MKLDWSLKELYSSFECEDFSKDMKKVDGAILEFNELVENLHKYDEKENIEKCIKLNLEMTKTITRIYDYCSLIFSVDTKNTLAAKYMDILEKKISDTIKAKTIFTNYIGNIKDLNEIISKSQYIKNFEFYLMELKEKNKYLLSKEEEIIIAKMKSTGSSTWEKLHSTLTASLMVEINQGEERKVVPLSVARDFAYDKDSEVRKAAYEGELKAYEKIEAPIAMALNAIKGEVLTIGKLRGYNSPLEETLIESRMDIETLNAMLEAINNSKKIFEKYFKRKAEILGHKSGLPFYDLFAPIGESNLKFSYEDAKKIIIENFTTFSDKLGNYARKAFNQNWIDVLPKEGKVGGAFCANLHCIGESRILTNFGENFSGVTTLAHELGHGYHGECLKDEEILNSEYPMPIAETASTFCETIVKKAAIKQASKEDALFILEQEISDSAQVIIDILSRYIFESKVFEIREMSSLSVEQIKETMLEAQKEAYGVGLDSEYLHGYMWLCKPHYYSGELSFYNFPYAFGLLFSKGLYAEYQKRGTEFILDYDILLKNTGKMKIEDITKSINIDITNKEFWINSLKIIEEDIDKFIELSE